MADEAFQVDLGRWFSERKVVGSHPSARLTEHGPCEMVKSSTKVPERNALVYGKSLDLVEDGEMRGVILVGPVHPAWTDHVNRQVASEQCPHLYRRRVGPQYDAAILRLDEQSVLHGARRMIGNEVEGVEVHPLGLELGALGHLPAHRNEDVFHEVHQRGDRVDCADRWGLDGQRHINSLLDQHPGHLCGLELLLACLERLVDRSAGPANSYASLLAGLRR